MVPSASITRSYNVAAPTISTSGMRAPLSSPNSCSLWAHTYNFTPAFMVLSSTSLSEGNEPILIFSASPFLTTVNPIPRKYTAASIFIVTAVCASISGEYNRSGLFTPLVWTYSKFCLLMVNLHIICLLYTSDAADEEDSVDLGG